MSTATITGRLTADAEIRWTPAGKAVLSATVADNHRKKTGDTWADDGASFWRITLWEKDAETYMDLLTKGTEIVATGEPRIVEWEGRDGTKGKTAELRNVTVGIRKRAARVGGTTAPADDPWASTAPAYDDTPPPF